MWIYTIFLEYKKIYTFLSLIYIVLSIFLGQFWLYESWLGVEASPKRPLLALASIL
jgi:hypothetical protein